jgi:RNA polymerase sigma factor (sigma-70 family)
VRALPRRQSEVLVLRYWAGLSEREIAETLGISAGSVKSAASRGMATLQTWLGGDR